MSSQMFTVYSRELPQAYHNSKLVAQCLSNIFVESTKIPAKKSSDAEKLVNVASLRLLQSNVFQQLHKVQNKLRKKHLGIQNMSKNTTQNKSDISTTLQSPPNLII